MITRLAVQAFARQTVVIASLAALVTLGSKPTLAGVFDRVTSSGKPVRVASHATWNRSCIGGPSLVEVVIPPAHGTLVGIKQTTTITRVESGTRACLGRPIEAEAVVYRPAPGFKGIDRFAYTSTTANGTVITHQGAVRVR